MKSAEIVHIPSGNGHRDAKLRHLSEEMARISRALQGLSRANGRHPMNIVVDSTSAQMLGSDASASEPLIRADEIRALVRARRMREQYFGTGLFADPAWDILLDLFAAHLEGDEIAVSSLCIAAAVPPTTATRVIRMMTDRGLLQHADDPRDGRRIFVALTPATLARLNEYFEAIRGLDGEVC